MSIWHLIAMFLSGLTLGLLLRPMIDQHEKKITKKIEELEIELEALKKEEKSEPEDLKSEIIGVITTKE